MITVDQWLRFRRAAGVLSFLGVVQFLIFSTLAMRFYPGGSLGDPKSPGYQYFQNPYSDLGRMKSWSQEDNTVSRWMFNGSLIALALLVTPFFFCLPTHAPDKFAVLWSATALGVSSSAALIGIALTPYDVYFRAHHLILLWWILSVLALAVIHFVALLTSRECGEGYALVSLGLAMIMGVYLSQGFDLAFATVSRFAKETTLEKTVPMQKYVIGYLVFWFLVFSYKTHRTAID